MLTPQEVSSCSFTKAAFGGYTMSQVDEFLDQLTEDYTALFKENAALKNKMKVLVEKVEEYRSTEDAMRATLVTAQKMADQTIAEANARKEDLLGKAEEEARVRIDQLRHEIASEEARLDAAKRETATFVDTMRSLCNQHMATLDQVPQLEFDTAPKTEASEEAKDSEPDVNAIEEKILASFEPEQEAPAEEEQKEEVPADDATRQFNLDDLKFGKSYHPEK